MNEKITAIGEWFLDSSNCPAIRGKECTVWISKRPHYCDRGNYLAHLEAFGELATDIDWQDGWPRYYMDLDRAKAEIVDWMAKRGQL